jgi:site-specific DNA-methyltransferase (adenine-specific)
MSRQPITENTLFYGDNLNILRDYILDESVDLIYLDPPFNSNRSYNVLFKDESGSESEAQITAFEDTWHWPQAAQTYRELLTNAPERISQLMSSLKSIVGTKSQMMAYLVRSWSICCLPSPVSNIAKVSGRLMPGMLEYCIIEQSSGLCG